MRYWVFEAARNMRNSMRVGFLPSLRAIVDMCKREHGTFPYRLYLIEARYLKAVAAAKIVSLLRDRMRRRRAQQERDALKRRAAAQEEKDKTTATRLVVTQCVAVLKKGRQCPNRTKEVSGGQLLC